METEDAVAALAQDNRLDVFRRLVRTGPQGRSSGEIADQLKIAVARTPEAAVARRRGAAHQ